MSIFILLIYVTHLIERQLNFRGRRAISSYLVMCTCVCLYVRVTVIVTTRLDRFLRHIEHWFLSTEFQLSLLRSRKITPFQNGGYFQYSIFPIFKERNVCNDFLLLLKISEPNENLSKLYNHSIHI